MTDQDKLTQIQIDAAVTREKVTHIQEDMNEIKALNHRVAQLEIFSARVKVWGAITWAIFLGSIGYLTKKIVGV